MNARQFGFQRLFVDSGCQNSVGRDAGLCQQRLAARALARQNEGRRGFVI